MYELTKDAEYLLCSLYKYYLDRREEGATKATAKRTGSSEFIFTHLMSEWKFEDVDETCCELCRAKLLSCNFADNVVYDSALTDAAIIYMENRFKNNVSELLTTLATLKSIIFK